MDEVLSRRSPLWFDVGEPFTVRVRLDDPKHLVEMAGELDVASRDAALRACTLPDQVHVVVDLANLTFMDCSGYGALVHARTTLEAQGGSLSLSGLVGEPLRLLSLVHHEFRAPSPLAPVPFSLDMDGETR